MYIAPSSRENTEALKWYCHVNAVLNNSDFKWFSKVDNELLSLSLFGRAFHTVGAATEKARLPNSVRVRWTCSRRLSTDSSESKNATGCRRVERYDAVEVERSLYVSTATLWEICWLTRSHCSDLSSGRASARPPRRHTALPKSADVRYKSK